MGRHHAHGPRHAERGGRIPLTFDLHQTLTDQIVAAIERVSADDFRLPWHRSGMSSIQPKNAFTKNAYRGINIVALWIAAEVHSYAHAIWASYKQWQELGAQVRKGERSSLVVFFKEYDVDPNPEDDHDDGKRRVARHSSVFNIAQVDGFALPEAPHTSVVERDAAADAFFAATNVEIRHGGERPFYHRRDDYIQMPAEHLFRGSQYGTPREDYYCVLGHEATHSTAHGSRLNRQLGKRFGDYQYSAEELVAELGSAFICAEFGISPQPRLDHAQYLKHWLQLCAALHNSNNHQDFVMRRNTKVLIG
jgi:antirestriction protein ArdC